MGDKPGQSTSAVGAPSLAAIDFDFEHRQMSVKRKTEVPQTPSMDLAAISLDLGTPGGGNGSGGAPDARWQEVATKLDLAKA